jgi:flagellar hook-associated protein 3 FlgL
MTRITNNFLVNRTLSDLQLNLRNLSDIQNSISTGLKFNRPSDNPIDYVTAISLRQSLNRGRRHLRNIDRGTTNLNLAEGSLDSVTSILQRARELTVKSINGSMDQAEYEAIADEISQIAQQVLQIANTNYEGTYMFGGTETLRIPFENNGGVISYHGNADTRNIEIGSGIIVPTNITGLSAFMNTPNQVTSSFAVSDPTAALIGELPAGSPPPVNGDFTINGVTISVDLTTDSLETLRDSINRADADVVASIDSSNHLVLDSRRSIDLEMSSGTSNVLESLGVFQHVSGADITGTLGAPITLATNITLAGIDLEGLRISNNGTDYDIDLDDPAINTVGDVINAINASGAGVSAFINQAGTGIDISATSSSSELEVKNMHRLFGDPVGAGIATDTTLASQGIGALTSIEVVHGADTTVVDLSSATTFGDVLALINGSQTGVLAQVNAAGTGFDLVVVDQTNTGMVQINEVGAGTSANDLGIDLTFDDNTADDLGVTGTGVVDEIEGKNIFKTLNEIDMLLRSGTTEDIVNLGSRLTDLDMDMENILKARSEAGASLNRLEATTDRLTRLDTFLVELLSENEDADLAEVVTQLSQQENTLQAALSATARVLLPSLLDYLR